MIAAYKGVKPKIPASAWIADSADVIGDVTLGENVNIWFGCVVRGDVHWIKIGDNTNIQDATVLHVTRGRSPLTIGARVSVGHKALLHGCTVGDDCLIGMGAILLDDVEVGSGSVVAAGALCPPGKKYPAGWLIMGSPAKPVRELTPQERKDLIDDRWGDYVGYANSYKTDFQVLK